MTTIKTPKGLFSAAIVLWLGGAVTGCGIGAADYSGFPSVGGGEFGATAGGVKDLALARELVKAGQVPPPEALLVEGAFSEHDLPLTGAPCAKQLCLRGALGIAPGAANEPAGFVQVAMSSALDPATFVRPSTTVIATVDVSGSMGWSASREFGGARPSAGALSYSLLKELASRLGPQDRIALVTYGSSVTTVLDVTVGGDPRIVAAIDSLREAGSTNMEAGLRRAYALAAAAKGNGTQQVRVMLFTDENPNVGATGTTEFSQMVAAGAEAGTGITVFGMGLGLRADLFAAMSHFRGGNAFSLSRAEDVGALMADSWPWMVSPLAYDLKLNLTAGAGFKIANSYGFPGAKDAAQLEVSSVFLSKRKGGLLVQLAPTAMGTAPEVLKGMSASGTLTYTQVDGVAQSEPLSVSYGGEPLDARGQFFPQKSVGVATALALVVSGMHDAAALYATDKAAGVAKLQTVLTRFLADRAALAEPSLDAEQQLAEGMLALMQKGAQQGNLYGY